MQLGIRLHDTKKLPFEERIANVHELGFACGHLAPGKVISEFPTTDEALTPGLAMYMKNVFAKNQVDVAVLGCYLNLANPNRSSLRKLPTVIWHISVLLPGWAAVSWELRPVLPTRPIPRYRNATEKKHYRPLSPTYAR